MNFMLKKLMLGAALALALSGTAWAQSKEVVEALNPTQTPTPVKGDVYWGNTGVDPLVPMKNPPTNVNDVLSSSMLKKDKKEDEIPYVRAQSIQAGAAAYGAQAGFAARARQLNQEIRQASGNYDRVFNFSALMLEPGFLPPVISEGRDAYEQANDSQVRAANRIYKIEFPARLVNTPPRWQDYLFIQEGQLTNPDRSVLPKSGAEKELWDQWVIRGWERGEALAQETFLSNKGRLQRDFNGMLRYKNLYAQGLVKKPILAKSYLGVTGGEDEMAIGDRIYEITEKAKLDPNSSRWTSPNPRTHIKDAPTRQRDER